MGRTAHCSKLYAGTILAPYSSDLTNTGGAPVVRKLGVAAASAALIGTIAAVMPAGMAGADVTGAPLPSPIGGLCTTDAQAPCWRATSSFDIGTATTRPTLPEVSGNKLLLNSATEKETGNAVWWNQMVPITGQSIEVSFNAYIDEGFQTQPIVAHGEGLTFALVEADASLMNNHNHPAPVPFSVDGAQYGYGSTGLAFSGFDGNDTTPTGGVDNVAGDKNLALALLTSNDDADVGGDQGHNVSR